MADRYTTRRLMRDLEATRIQDMFSPARCTHCRAIYDLGTVTVTARYADCSVWTSPCCKRTVDDRTWKGLPDIQKIDKATCDPQQMTPDGRIMFDPHGWADGRG